VSEQDLVSLREQFPNVGIVKTVHVYPERSLEEVISDTTKHLASGIIDAVNLDSKKSRASAQTGGTGVAHDWNISASVVRHFRSTPIILAGGLTSENVRRAAETVRPYAVDVMSGVEVERGRKSVDRVRSFFAALSQT
jgi:phosphoribosylanthranilate isomerase